MDQKDITLELLVRSGNPEGVGQFAESEGLGESIRVEKTAEAGVYSAIRYMWDEAEGGIDSERACDFLSQDIFTNYFSTVNNTEVLGGIVDVLQAGMEAMMEPYAQITAIDVLGVESLADAIRRNINAPNMRQKVTDLVKCGYSLVFCPEYIDAEMVGHYFPIIDKWREFVNPADIAKRAVVNFKVEDLLEDGHRQDFVSSALDKLVELAGRETVSRLVYERFGDSEPYGWFIESGKVDVYTPTPKPAESTNAALNRALKKYEGRIFPSSLDVRDLAKAAGNDDKEYVAKRMGAWFREGKVGHFLEVARHDGSLYDYEVARKVVGEGIAEASKAGDLARLDCVLNLPPHLIDEANPAISGVVVAYKISQQTKGQK